MTILDTRDVRVVAEARGLMSFADEWLTPNGCVSIVTDAIATELDNAMVRLNQQFPGLRFTVQERP